MRPTYRRVSAEYNPARNDTEKRSSFVMPGAVDSFMKELQVDEFFAKLIPGDEPTETTREAFSYQDGIDKITVESDLYPILVSSLEICLLTPTQGSIANVIVRDSGIGGWKGP